jgi:hypothetical protein
MYSGAYIIPYFYPQVPDWQDGEIITVQGNFSDIRTEAITQDYGNMGLVISGHVMSFPSEPLAGARVYAFHENETDPTAFALTDDNGYYEIVNGLIPGSYTVKCDLYGYNFETFQATIHLDLAYSPIVENIDFILTDASTGTAEIASFIKTGEISGNYPNPFNSNTLIKLYSDATFQYESKITVFNMLGEKVGQKDISIKPGYNTIEWGISDFRGAAASGIYFYRIDGINKSYRMIYLK